MKHILIIVICSFGFSTYSIAQIGEVRNDTIYIVIDVNKPVEFSKAIGKYLYIQDIIPPDLPEKSRHLLLISSNSVEVDPKLIQVINNKHLIIPLEVFIEKYYTLYIKKGGATIASKKLIIR